MRCFVLASLFFLLGAFEVRADINGCVPEQIHEVAPGTYRFGIEVIPDPGAGQIDYSFDCGHVGGTHLYGWRGTIAFRSRGDCAPQHLSSLVIGGVVFPFNQKLPRGGAETLFIEYVLPKPVQMVGTIFHLNADVDRVGDCEITVEYQGLVFVE